MRHGSLFSGIGGFDLAAEWMGNNKFCQRVLKYHWPKAELFEDIKQTSFEKFNGTIDIISGGFPCQPYSQTGRRKGKTDDRHLWPEMFRAIGEVQPSWVVGENVPGLLNWQRGMVLDEIRNDLEAAGFEVFPPFVLPACGKNAPHRRYRVFIIAHRNGFNGSISIQQRGQDQTENTYVNRINTNNKSKRLQGSIQTNEEKGEKHNDKLFNGHNREWEQSTIEVATRLCRVDARIPNRMDRIKAIGNSVNPYLVLEIFKTIEQFENKNKDFEIHS